MFASGGCARSIVFAMAGIASVAAAFLTPIALTTSAMAAEEAGAAQDSGGLEEVVVTARRREESLMSVPVSVTAVTASSLAAYNLDTVERIGESIPHVQMISAASGRAPSSPFAAWARFESSCPQSTDELGTNVPEEMPWISI